MPGLRKWCVSYLLAAAIFSAPANGQKVRPAPVQEYDRILCVVPMVGAGTSEDPRRPLFAPVAGQRAAGTPRILQYTFVVSDDGKSALVEFQAADRAAFKEMLESRRADVRVFERGKAKKAEVEQVFRQYKKDFEWRQLGVGL